MSVLLLAVHQRATAAAELHMRKLGCLATFSWLGCNLQGAVALAVTPNWRWLAVSERGAEEGFVDTIAVLHDGYSDCSTRITWCLQSCSYVNDAILIGARTAVRQREGSKIAAPSLLGQSVLAGCAPIYLAQLGDV